jgi:hypothetical protein
MSTNITWKRDLWDGNLPQCPRCGGDTYVTFGPSILDLKENYIASMVCRREGIAFKFDIIESMINWIKKIEEKESPVKTIKVKSLDDEEFVTLSDKKDLYSIIVEKKAEDKSISTNKLNVLSDPNWKCDLVDVVEISFNKETKELTFFIENKQK